MAKVVLAPIKLGSVHDVPLGQGRCFLVGSEEIAVFRQRDGRLFATQNRCPHRQGPLSEGIVGADRVICPLHARQFNLESGKGIEHADCVQAYSVSEVDGEIVLVV